MSSKYIKFNKENLPLNIRKGNCLIPGTSYILDGINFNIFSKNGENLYLVIFHKGEEKPIAEILFPPHFKVGDNFNMFVSGIDWSLYDYCLRMSGENNLSQGLLFDENVYLLDPRASKVNGMEVWGKQRNYLHSETLSVDFSRDMVDVPKLPLEKLIIYELHVRGFSAGDKFSVAPGTFLGLEEKIPYLKKLGVNCVELMPIFEFDELQNTNLNPFTKEPLKNYWGYQTISFYAPKAGYAKGEVIEELRHLINALHENNIECILDVVFNHTGEMGSDGPCLSFRGIDNKTYYMLDENGEPFNYTGCGNTFNCNNSVVREFILSALRYWRCQYFIDGFRFDLASVMTRDEKGNVLSNPPLIEAISNDPILADCKMIAEPWDASGLYQLGGFGDSYSWLEWNGQFRDVARSFLRGDCGTVENLIKRVSGSKDIYGDNHFSSVNFVCCHDGFTLKDLFSYNSKHNEANGEDNRDGNDFNLSWNCGVEGETEDEEILKLRHKQVLNALTLLFMSKGVPMLLMGDECGRTQQGNNNAYCQDNELSWFDWSLPEKNKDIWEFCRDLIAFRKENTGLWGGNMVFHGVELNKPDTCDYSHTLAWTLESEGKMIYVCFNMFTELLEFRLPEGNWGMMFSSDSNFVMDGKVFVKPYSSVVLVRGK